MVSGFVNLKKTICLILPLITIKKKFVSILKYAYEVGCFLQILWFLIVSI